MLPLVLALPSLQMPSLTVLFPQTM